MEQNQENTTEQKNVIEENPFSGDSTESKSAKSGKIERFLKRYNELKESTGLKRQIDISKATGIHQAHISVIESGKHLPQQKTIKKLAVAFGVTVESITDAIKE